MSDGCEIPESAANCAPALSDKDAATTSQVHCFNCGTEGEPVEKQTILHHLKHEQLGRVNGEAYRFCPDSDCEVVYYGDGGTRFTIDDLRELVTTKTTGDTRPICYCFGFTEGDARQEIELAGHSTIPTTISLLIKAHMCACEIRNPAGVCCLGQVNQTVKRLAEERNAVVELAPERPHDCCASGK